VLHVHAQLALAALALTSTITYYVSKEDSIVLSVLMFHVASWVLPYAGLIVGAKLVLPGPHPQPADLLNVLSDEQGTFVAGVPTVWHDAANLVENYPGRWTFSPKLRLILGGSAAPEALIRRWESFGVTVIHGWGMSEVLLGLQSHVKLADFPPEKRYELLLEQGMPSPFVEAKVLPSMARKPRGTGRRWVNSWCAAPGSPTPTIGARARTLSSMAGSAPGMSP